MKKYTKLSNNQEIVNGFYLSMFSDTTHSHVSAVLRYGGPGMQLLVKNSTINGVEYQHEDLWSLLLPFYISGISGLESKWCAPNTIQLTVDGFMQRYILDLFVPQRDVVRSMCEHNGFGFDYGGYGIVASYNGVSVIVDGSKRACVAALKNESFHAIEIESNLVPLLWSCEFFQSAVKGLL